MSRLPRHLPQGTPADWDARGAIVVVRSERADIYDERTRRAHRRIFAVALIALAAAGAALVLAGHS